MRLLRLLPLAALAALALLPQSAVAADVPSAKTLYHDGPSGRYLVDGQWWFHHRHMIPDMVGDMSTVWDVPAWSCTACWAFAAPANSDNAPALRP